MKTFKNILYIIGFIAIVVIIVYNSIVWATNLPETATLWNYGVISGWVMVAIIDVITCGFCAIPFVVFYCDKH